MTSNDALIGHQLANFRIERLLGRGGMATVYYGWDVKLDRPVAIKVIDARHQDKPTYAQRFINEARMISTWRHDNILQIHYADDENGLYYFVMEYVRGLDLGQLLLQYAQAGEFMPHGDVLRIGRAVAAALDYAHQRGVIHRDVKPTNVLISEEDRVYLTDFGLAMEVARGTVGEVFGSPHYIAPEQARDSAGAIPQSDLYSLGVMLYEMLTGEVPFDDPSPMSLALQHVMLPPPPPRQVNPDLSQAVENVLLKALQKSPEERYQSGRELIDALEEALQGMEVVPAHVEPLPPPPPESAVYPPRAVSQVSVAERVVQDLASRPPTPPPTPVRESAGVPPSRPRSRLPAWSVVGCAALLLAGALIVVFGLVYVLNLPAAPLETGTGFPGSRSSSMTASPAALLASPASPSAPTSLPVTASATGALPSETGTPSQTPIPPTDIPADTPTDTLAPTATSPPPTPAPTATSLPPTTPPPTGDRFEMYYDDTAFYIKNTSARDRSIYPLAFERLDSQGNILNRFDGWVWGNIYSTFRAGFCMVMKFVEITRHLDPPECNDLHLVLHQPTMTRDYIFWTSREDSGEFRVLWDDVEVGRCEIAAGTCEVYLP